MHLQALLDRLDHLFRGAVSPSFEQGCQALPAKDLTVPVCRFCDAIGIDGQEIPISQVQSLFRQVGLFNQSDSSPRRVQPDSGQPATFVIPQN